MPKAKVELHVVDGGTEHVNEEGGELRCERCHKKVGYMATFYRWRGLVVGPECSETAQTEGKGVRGTDKLRTRLWELFIEAKRRDTVNGMRAKGMLP